MDPIVQLLLELLGEALDNPSLQEQITGPVARFLRAKIPGADQKALGDLIVRLGTEVRGA